MPPKKPAKRLTIKKKVPKKSTKKAKEALEESEEEVDVQDGDDYDESPTRSHTRSPSPRDPTPPPAEAGTSKAKPKKPKQTVTTLLTDDDEVGLGEWLRLHECIFRKTLKRYHDAPHKKGLWQDKARELKLESGQLLQTWYNSIRTRIGKIHKLRSASATKELTARDAFLWSNFGFLSDHIHTMKGRTAVTLNLIADLDPPSRASSTMARSQDSSGSDLEDDLETSVLERQLSTEKSADSFFAVTWGFGATTADKGRGKVKGASRVRDHSDEEVLDINQDVLSQLERQQRETGRIVGNIGTMLTGEKMSSNAAWGVWMGTLADKIDERLHHQMIRSTTTTSRLFPPLQPLPPVPAAAYFPIQQLQQYQQQQQPNPQQQQQGNDDIQGAGTSTFLDMIPPLAPVPHRNGSWGRQSQQQQGQSSHQQGQSQSQSQWDTTMPTSGQRTAINTSNTIVLPPRPNSTPNLSQSSIPNLSGLSDVLNTPQNLIPQSPSDQQGLGGGGFLQ